MFYLSPFCYICKSFTRKLVRSKHIDNDTAKLLEKLQFCGIENIWVKPDNPISICYKCSRILDFMYKFKKMFIESNNVLRRYVIKLEGSDAQYNHSRLCIMVNAKDTIVATKKPVKKTIHSEQNVEVQINTEQNIETSANKECSKIVDINSKSLGNNNGANSLKKITEKTIETRNSVDLNRENEMNRLPIDIKNNWKNIQNKINEMKQLETIINDDSNLQSDKSTALIQLNNLTDRSQGRLKKYTPSSTPQQNNENFIQEQVVKIAFPAIQNTENPTQVPSVSVTRKPSTTNSGIISKNKELEYANVPNLAISKNVIAEFSVDQILIKQEEEMCNESSDVSVNIDNNLPDITELVKCELTDPTRNVESIFIKQEMRDNLINEEYFDSTDKTSVESVIVEATNVDTNMGSNLLKAKISGELINKEDNITTDADFIQSNSTIVPPKKCVARTTNDCIAKSKEKTSVQPNLVAVMKNKLLNILKQTEPQIYHEIEEVSDSTAPKITSVNVANDLEQIANINEGHSMTLCEQPTIDNVEASNINQTSIENSDANNTTEQLLYNCSVCKRTFVNSSTFAEHLLTCKLASRKLDVCKRANRSEHIIDNDGTAIKCLSCDTCFADFEVYLTHMCTNIRAPVTKIRKLSDINNSS